MPDVTHKNEVYDPEHELWDYKDGVNYTMIFWVFLFLFTFFNYYANLLHRLMNKLGVFHDVIVDGKEALDAEWNFLIEYDEDLGEYW